MIEAYSESPIRIPSRGHASISYGMETDAETAAPFLVWVPGRVT